MVCGCDGGASTSLRRPWTRSWGPRAVRGHPVVSVDPLLGLNHRIRLVGECFVFKHTYSAFTCKLVSLYNGLSNLRFYSMGYFPGVT